MTRRNLALVQGNEPTPLTLLITDYLRHCRAGGLSVRTVETSYGYVLQRVFLPWAVEQGITDVSELTSRRLDDYTGQLNSQPGKSGRVLSKATVNSYTRPVNIFLGWAKEEGEQVNGKAQVRKAPKRVRDVLSRAEIQQLEDAAQNERDRLIIRLIADTGIRRGELVGLTTDSLVSRGRHFLLSVIGKGDKERLVIVDPKLWRRVSTYIRRDRPRKPGSDWLFLANRRNRAGEYEQLTGSGVQQLVRVLGTQAGLTKRIYPHLLRHSFVTHMVLQGVPEEAIAGALGHESLAMVHEVYTHIRPAESHDAILKALLSG